MGASFALTMLSKSLALVAGQPGVQNVGLGHSTISERNSVRGGDKIPKKGGIKFPTSCGNMVSYDGKTIIGGPKEDENIGRVS